MSPRPFSVCLVVSESLSLFAFLICSASPISLFLLDVSLLCVPVNEDVSVHIYTRLCCLLSLWVCISQGQSTSGIAGYTLIFTSRNMRIVSHQPFAGKRAAIRENHDIANDSLVIEELESRMKVAQTDQGIGLQEKVDDLLNLLKAYRTGAVAESH